MAVSIANYRLPLMTIRMGQSVRWNPSDCFSPSWRHILAWNAFLRPEWESDSQGWCRSISAGVQLLSLCVAPFGHSETFRRISTRRMAHFRLTRELGSIQYTWPESTTRSFEGTIYCYRACSSIESFVYVNFVFINFNKKLIYKSYE